MDELLIAIKGRVQKGLMEFDALGRLKAVPDYGHFNLALLAPYLSELEVGWVWMGWGECGWVGWVE